MLDELVVDHLIAVAELSEIFPDLPIAAYVQTTDATVARRGRVAAELLQELDVITMLDRLVERFSFWPGEQLKLVRDRDHIPPESVMRPGADGRPRINSARLAERLEDGFTVVFDGIELRHRPSNRLAALFEAAFGCAVNINGYLSAQPVPSFGSHWDDQEVVIIQLIGSKDWSVEEPVALSMHKDVHGTSTSGRPVWAGTLQVGDCLYVPRGWGHYVTAPSGLSFHYTITIPRLNGLMLIDQLLDTAARQPLTVLPDDRDRGDALRGEVTLHVGLVHPAWESPRSDQLLELALEKKLREPRNNQGG